MSKITQITNPTLVDRLVVAKRKHLFTENPLRPSTIKTHVGRFALSEQGDIYEGPSVEFVDALCTKPSEGATEWGKLNDWDKIRQLTWGFEFGYLSDDPRIFLKVKRRPTEWEDAWENRQKRGGRYWIDEVKGSSCYYASHDGEVEGIEYGEDHIYVDHKKAWGDYGDQVNSLRIRLVLPAEPEAPIQIWTGGDKDKAKFETAVTQVRLAREKDIMYVVEDDGAPILYALFHTENGVEISGYEGVGLQFLHEPAVQKKCKQYIQRQLKALLKKVEKQNFTDSDIYWSGKLPAIEDFHTVILNGKGKPKKRFNPYERAVQAEYDPSVERFRRLDLDDETESVEYDEAEYEGVERFRRLDLD